MLFNMLNAGSIVLLALSSAELGVNALAHPSLVKRSPPVSLGLAATYGAIAGTGLTSTGNTVVTGDCGTCPGTAITGFPPGECTGTTSAAGTAACDAEASCLTAYNNAKGLVPTFALQSSDLAGMILDPGVYTFPSAAAALSATLILNGTADPNGQFIFQISTTLTTAANAVVELINGAQPCNVYFQVGSSATIAEGTQLQGNILAYASIGLSNAVTNNGTLCGLNGAVTLINNALTASSSCTS